MDNLIQKLEEVLGEKTTKSKSYRIEVETFHAGDPSRPSYLTRDDGRIIEIKLRFWWKGSPFDEQSKHTIGGEKDT